MGDRSTRRAAAFLALLLSPGFCLSPARAEDSSDAKADQPAARSEGGQDGAKRDADGSSTRGALEIRANNAFSRGEYAVALPILKKLAEDAKGDAKRLGPLEELIRVCERKLRDKAIDAQEAAAAGGAAAASATASAAADGQSAATERPAVPANPPTSAEERKPHPAPKEGEVIELLIQGLGNFEYDQEKGGNIPADVRRLSGHRIRVKGFMIPMDQADKITQFALVPDLFACCFGQPPQVQHTLVVNCPAGKAVSYHPEEIVVEGTLKVEEKKDDGYIISIFEVEALSVKPAPK